ncbi:MAG: WbuC family cupin fold metalloprotein [Bacteroidetes bacterium]|jgi:cupin fold WbuC family metalloprotein|nr:WbuC family cupin fold metalloprotein [Bacteroidota bacterium]MBT6836718.1 WbuC family cupin fold metalloprotein [Bacteroidota bacterium]
MLKITNEFVTELSANAKANYRKRLHHNFHKNYDEKVQRLLNACDPTSYFRPHCHADSNTTETIILVRGRMLVVEFDVMGNIIDHIILQSNEGHIGVELSPETWHSMIALEEETVMFEIKQGPFDPEKKKLFADWSPEEGSEDAKSFNQKILEELGLS